MSARLSGLTIGALTLTPTFDPNTTEYTATTTNATNTVTATPEDEDATVTILKMCIRDRSGTACMLSIFGQSANWEWRHTGMLKCNLWS